MKTLLVMAGGTGGHVYPALAVAQSLIKRGVRVIWLGCGYFLGTPYWMAILMGPVTMAAELPKLKWIDDNATMLLIPAAVVLILAPFL